MIFYDEFKPSLCRPCRMIFPKGTFLKGFDTVIIIKPGIYEHISNHHVRFGHNEG